MATIQLNNNDLRVMICEAVERLCEGQWYETEPLCRLPYFVSVNFSDHAIDRENERDIREQDIVDILKMAVKDVIDDFSKRNIRSEDYVKVIDRDSCVVAVCGIKPSYNGNRIKQLVVVTTYVWDGKINIDAGYNYYVNEPSEKYAEAKAWNEENQDKVVSYMEWKRNSDINRQRKRAETEYYWRNHPHEPSREKVMNRMDQAYIRKEKSDKHKIHDQLPDGDLKAIQDYFRDMNNKRIELEPLYETARNAVKKALQEALSKQMNTNTFQGKSALNGGLNGPDPNILQVLQYCAKFFRGKSIYCPCDGPDSAIYRYFKDNFKQLGLKTLVATKKNVGGRGNGRGSALIHHWSSRPNFGEILDGDGDFRSKECRNYTEECDIVVTNPPAEIFSALLGQCMEFGKKFILLGDRKSAFTKDMSRLIKTGEVKQAPSTGSGIWFTNLPVSPNDRLFKSAGRWQMKSSRPASDEKLGYDDELNF